MKKAKITTIVAMSLLVSVSAIASVLVIRADEEVTKMTDINSQLRETVQVLTEDNTSLNANFTGLQDKYIDVEEQLNEESRKNSTLESENAKLKKQIERWKDGVFFKITHYCSCSICSEQWGTQTATQTVTTAGRTVAVDPSVIPLGSIVDIEGYGTYIAEDVGGGVKGNHIDVYVSSHSEAMSKGVKYKSVNWRRKNG